MSDRPIIEMRGIDKHFGAVHALRNVDFHLMPGEVLGLVGDNSAGKSTLMKVLTGAYQRDAGEVRVDGEITHFRSPQDSRDRGSFDLGLVHLQSLETRRDASMGGESETPRRRNGCAGVANSSPNG